MTDEDTGMLTCPNCGGQDFAIVLMPKSHTGAFGCVRCQSTEFIKLVYNHVDGVAHEFRTLGGAKI